MAPKDLIVDGAKFVPNNYAAILTNSEAPGELHFVQDFLYHSEISFALTQPASFNAAQVLTFWRTGTYDDGGENGATSLTVLQKHSPTNAQILMLYPK